MVRSSGQHKCGLVLCGMMMLVLGAGIATTGFLNDFLDPYDELSKPERTYFTHTQYWLGIPLFLLGLFVLATSFCKISCLMVFGLMATSFLLVLSICAVILEGPVWRATLRSSIRMSELDDCEDDKNDQCRCRSSSGVFGFSTSCDEVNNRTIIYSFMVVFSALAILICMFCAFIYFRILGWMLHISYEDPIDDYYAKAVSNHFINGHHGGGPGRINDIALGTYPQ